MPAAVGASERMKFINDDDLEVLEELPVFDLRGHENDFEGLRGGKETVGRVVHHSAFLALSRVAVPAGGSSPDQLKVPLEPLFLIVQQRPDRTHVEDRETRPRLSKHLREDRKESRFSLAPGSRRKNNEVGTVQTAFNRQILHRSQFSPAEGIDHVVLQSRM